MADRPSLSDADLALLLEDLRDHIEDPPRAAILAAVQVGLATETAPGAARAKPPVWRARTLRFALVGTVVALVLSVTLTVSPAARRAVADWLGLRGVLVEYQAGLPPTHLGGHLSLGHRVTLAEARRRVTFEMLLPPITPLGLPDELYVADTPAGGQVTLVYRARLGLPAAAPSGVGLLITEFRAQIPDQIIRKVVGADVRFEHVTVSGEPGYWFEGRPHQLTFADQNGRFFAANSRLAGHTLIWQHGPLTLRLESAFTKDKAIQAAAALTGQRSGTR